MANKKETNKWIKLGAVSAFIGTFATILYFIISATTNDTFTEPLKYFLATIVLFAMFFVYLEFFFQKKPDL